MNEEFIKESLKNANSVQVIESDADIDLEESARAIATRIYALFAALMEAGFDREEAFAIILATSPN